MQITLDTQKDSKEDMRKLAAFLSSLAESHANHQPNIFEDQTPSLNLFADSNQQQPQQQAQAQSENSGDILGNIFGNAQQSAEQPKQEENKEEIQPGIEIVPY